jgi:hypothetical protein
VTTLIFIENVLGSGQLVKLKEDFGDYSVSRDLRPGENTRVIVSPFKSISLEESPLTVSAAPSRQVAFAGDAPPAALQRRFGGRGDLRPPAG